MYCATLCTFVQGFGPLAMAPMFPFYMEMYGRSLSDVIDFTGVAILVLGFSNFLWYVGPFVVVEKYISLVLSSCQGAPE